MLTKFLRCEVIALAALTSMPAVAQVGAACVLLGKSGTEVLVNGRPQAVPLRLSDCLDVVAPTGGVAACYIAANGRRTCSELPANVSVRRSGILEPNSNSIRLAPTVIMLLRGDVQTRPGLTRATGPIRGFPSGSVYLGSSDLLFATSHDARVEGATQFELRKSFPQESRPIVASRTASGFTVPSAALERGETYQWTIAAPDGKYSGTFRLDANERPGLDDAIRAVEADFNLAPSSKAYLKAELFEEYGLPFNRDRELDTARLLLQ